MLIVLGVLAIAGLIWLLRRNRDNADGSGGHVPAGGSADPELPSGMYDGRPVPMVNGRSDGSMPAG